VKVRGTPYSWIGSKHSTEETGSERWGGKGNNTHGHKNLERASNKEKDGGAQKILQSGNSLNEVKKRGGGSADREALTSNAMTCEGKIGRSEKKCLREGIEWSRRNESRGRVQEKRRKGRKWLGEPSAVLSIRI